MAQKAPYRSAIRSRRLIREAFLKLVQEKEYSKITVTAIVKLADLNRSTFYAHYPDVRGIVEEMENEIIDKQVQVIRSLEWQHFLQDPMPVLMEAGRYLEEQADSYRILLRVNEAQSFLLKLKQIFVDTMLANPHISEEIRSSLSFRLRIHFFAGGIVQLYRKWLLQEIDCSIHELSAEISFLVKNLNPSD